MKCRYWENCKDFDNCNDEVYCGFKENFMKPEAAEKYREKHLGKMTYEHRGSRVQK